MLREHTTNDTGQEKQRLKPQRPHFHFTPKANWMNDPNGLVHFDGEYHLFYQHTPDSCDIGALHWGHAVSHDLIHWRHLPVAISPDDKGYIYSGCAVVDWNNTSGLGENGQPPLIAIFTYHNTQLKAENSNADCESQGLAYSNDKGRTWLKHSDNPILPNPGGRPDFRDPTMFWDEPRGRWVMTLSVTDRAEFYTSPDLLNWNLAGAFQCDLAANGGVWECANLFQMSVNGGVHKKWVLLVSVNPGAPGGGSGTQFFVGDFDGYTFTLDNAFREQLTTRGPQWIDGGEDNYAGAIWSDIPSSDGRRLFIAWMNNWRYACEAEDTQWRGAMTMPRSLSLIEEDGRHILCANPVHELDAYLGPAVTQIDHTLEPDSQGSCQIPLNFPAGEINIDLSLQSIAAPVSICFEISAHEWLKLVIDKPSEFIVERCGLEPGSKHKSLHIARNSERPTLQLRILIDHGSIEFFADEGRTVITERTDPAKPFEKLTINGLTEGVGITEFSTRVFKAHHQDS